MSNKNNSLFPKKSNVFNNSLIPNPLKNNLINKPKTTRAATIKETDKEYLVEVPAPNMQKEDFQIQLSNDVLTIKGETSQASQNKDANNRTNMSFNYQSFQKSFKVDESIVDQDNIEVTYTDGVLNIVLPKNEDNIQAF
jgi:HSP20 family protein